MSVKPSVISALVCTTGSPDSPARRTLSSRGASASRPAPRNTRYEPCAATSRDSPLASGKRRASCIPSSRIAAASTSSSPLLGPWIRSDVQAASASPATSGVSAPSPSSSRTRLQWRMASAGTRFWIHAAARSCQRAACTGSPAPSQWYAITPAASPCAPRSASSARDTAACLRARCSPSSVRYATSWVRPDDLAPDRVVPSFGRKVIDVYDRASLRDAHGRSPAVGSRDRGDATAALRGGAWMGQDGARRQDRRRPP